MGSRIDNTAVIIPSYNESRTIGSTVKDIVKMGLSVIVIDDGSTDNTECIALDNGAIVMRNRQNFGKGFSIREGIKYILKKTNFEWTIIMDADGQHHVEDIHVLMEATNVTGEEEVDLVIGNRMGNTEAMPPVRYWTNRIMSWVISGMCHQDIPDTQCGYRLVKIGVLEKLKLTSKKYDIDSEMLIQAAANKLNIKSAFVRTIYGEEVSEIKPVRDTIRFLSLILRHKFGLK